MNDFQAKILEALEKTSELVEIDTMEVLEEVNPEVKQKYNESNELIFKQPISIENARDICDLVSATECDYAEYKGNLVSKCNMIMAAGQSPTEMLVYASKAIVNKVYLGAVLDILKHLHIKDTFFKEAYRNILSSWGWNECLKIVLQSIKTIRISGLDELIYKIFCSNQKLQKLAALTLITLQEIQYYPAIIDRLVSEQKYTQREIDNIKIIFSLLAKSDEIAPLYLYRAYLKNVSMVSVISNCLIGCIRHNFSQYILDDISKVINDPEQPREIYSRIVYLLTHCNKNAKVIEFIQGLGNIPYIDIRRLKASCTVNDMYQQIRVARDTEENLKMRKDAILRLVAFENSEVEQVLTELEEQSDMFNILVNAVRVEKGQVKSIVPIFRYLMDSTQAQDVVQEASYQIKRLCNKRIVALEEALYNIAQVLFEQPVTRENKQSILLILDIYCYVHTNNKTATSLVHYLEKVDDNDIKSKLFEYFVKNFSILSETEQNQIKEIISAESRAKSSLSAQAINSLRGINAGADAVPTINREYIDIEKEQ